MACKPTSRSEEVIHLDVRKNNHRVVIHPADEDLFVISMEQAVSACRAGESGRKFDVQFRKLLGRLGEWILQNTSKISQAVVTTRDAGLMFIVVMSGISYDSDLEASLSKLDVDIASDSNFDLICLSVLSLPNYGPDTCESFISGTAWVYGGLAGDA